MNSGRLALIYYAVIYDGNRDAIIRAVTKREKFKYEDIRKVVRSVKSKTLTYLDPEYPNYLKLMPNAPIVLFYYGDISLIDDYHHKYNLALVGTRTPTEYGKYHTKKIVTEVAKDCNIVSGMAKGIDGVAHRAALENKAKTVAVLGSGIDNPWPSDNVELYHDIIKSGGLVISEYPGMSEPSRYHFPIRNRLIAMFSKALLVTEAIGMNSGTGITVGFANMLNISVMSLPYPAEQIDSFCNELIFEGARLVRDGKDVLTEMELQEIKII